MRVNRSSWAAATHRRRPRAARTAVSVAVGRDAEDDRGHYSKKRLISIVLAKKHPEEPPAMPGESRPGGGLSAPAIRWR
ncbi:MAG: hypothetical protein MZV64_28925 [Ignavibacteriales bacterium]|nr:hypothetical protein [Ignavibacteriales bacterium]